MKYPLAEKAVAQMTQSYEAFGGAVPKQAKVAVGGAIAAIDNYIDRPQGEKDALMAATALYFSTDMTVYKTLPDNVDEYGEQVKAILQDALANPLKPFGASRDLMQIGLALSLPMKDVAIKMLEQTREKISAIAEDPKLLKEFIRKMQQAIVKGQKDGALHFTGEQPKLELKAKEVMEAIKTRTEDLVAYMVRLLDPPANDTGKPKPASPTP
jgi:hypothetical protein